MAATSRGYDRPTKRDFLDTAERFAGQAVRDVSWVCEMLAKAGQSELFAEAVELRDRAKALSARVSDRYHGEVTDGK